MPKVSIIIPIYNVERYVEECILSVMNQTLKDIEIICVDDCSTDKSLEIVENLSQIDNRIMIITNEENVGQSATRNKGMQYAKGEYVYFLDSDDMIVPETLESLYSISKKRDLDILYFNSTDLFENNKLKSLIGCRNKHNYIVNDVVSGKELFISFMKYDWWDVSVCCQLYKRSFFVKNNFYFCEGILHEDDLFSLQTILKANRTYCEPIQLHVYRHRINSTTTDTSLYTKRLLSMSYIYMQYKTILKECCDDELCKYVIQLIDGMARSIVRVYTKIDSIDIKWDGNEDALSVIKMLTTVLYGGFFPYKLPSDIMNKIRNSQHVIIYGAGEIGRGLLELLTEREVIVECFIVTSVQKLTECMGHQVIAISSLKVSREDTIILIASRKDSEIMKKTAEENGFTNVLVVNPS
jgi:glycosyltransferase involved in cell wall biosynthesis